jgi:transposase
VSSMASSGLAIRGPMARPASGVRSVYHLLHADWIRVYAAARGAWANILPRCNRTEPICFSPYLYRAHNLVARFFNMIKHYCRVATRYDRLAANYLAFIQLASIKVWLRVNESAP